MFVSVLAGLFSTRSGFSFLLAGILAGEDGIGDYRFDDFRLSVWVGNLALAIILLDGRGAQLAGHGRLCLAGPAGMFVLLGLLVTPSTFMDMLIPSVAVAAVLLFVARPVAVWLCLVPFRFSPRETWFISWVGLRGAVPIVLAMFPLPGRHSAGDAVQRRLRRGPGLGAQETAKPARAHAALS